MAQIYFHTHSSWSYLSFDNIMFCRWWDIQSPCNFMLRNFLWNFFWTNFFFSLWLLLFQLFSDVLLPQISKWANCQVWQGLDPQCRRAAGRSNQSLFNMTNGNKNSTEESTKVEGQQGRNTRDKTEPRTWISRQTNQQRSNEIQDLSEARKKWDRGASNQGDEQREVGQNSTGERQNFKVTKDVKVTSMEKNKEHKKSRPNQENPK